MSKETHAGAGVVQPLPSRQSSLFEESRPLQIFLENVPAMRTAMREHLAPAFAFSPLNAFGKIGLGKWEVIPKPGALLLGPPGDLKVAPTGSRAEYYAAITDLLADGQSVSLVPEWVAMHLKKGGFKVAKQHDEYVMETVAVQEFPGGRNRQMRGNVNKARRLCTVEHFHADQLDEYKQLVRTWYRQNVDLKFRTYDKTSIDWLFENWKALKAAVPDLVCLGIRHDAQLISLNMGCLNTDGHWTAYTQRFDREAEVKHGNMLGYNELAKIFSEVPLENDGTADTKTIKEWKDRLVHHKIPFYTVSK